VDGARLGSSGIQKGIFKGEGFGKHTVWVSGGLRLSEYTSRVMSMVMQNVSRSHAVVSIAAVTNNSSVNVFECEFGRVDGGW
jgi:hypothetical protein